MAAKGSRGGEQEDSQAAAPAARAPHVGGKRLGSRKMFLGYLYEGLIAGSEEKSFPPLFNRFLRDLWVVTK